MLGSGKSTGSSERRALYGGSFMRTRILSNAPHHAPGTPPTSESSSSVTPAHELQMTPVMRRYELWQSRSRRASVAMVPRCAK